MSSPLKFPNEELLRALRKSGQLNSTLLMLANALAEHISAPWAPDLCRDCLRSNDSEVVHHEALRKAVFYAVISKHLILNSPVETYWDVVTRFGPTNQRAIVDYLIAAPKSVPLKLGRLLLAKAEHGTRPLSFAELQQVLAVLFAAPTVATGVITRAWLQELARIRSPEADLMAKMAKAYAPEGPIQALVTLFPQLGADQAHLLLVRSGSSVEELTQYMLDDPTFVENTLSGERAAAVRPKQYVTLDEEEKQRRADAQKQRRRLEFSFRYTSFEDEDPDPETEDVVQHELSDADKKLVAQEQLLWGYWHSNPEIFDRRSRKTSLRKTLLAKLNWSDEQIEGWGRVSAKSTSEGANELNVPKHMRAVESYVPAMRHPLPDVTAKKVDPDLEIPREPIQQRAQGRQSTPHSHEVTHQNLQTRGKPPPKDDKSSNKKSKPAQRKRPPRRTADQKAS